MADFAASAGQQTGTAGRVIVCLLLLLVLVAPFIGLYPIFVMKVLCFGLFASAFNLLLGFGGLLSFGHAAFFGSAAYVAAHAVKVWGLPPELGILAGTIVASLLGLLVGWFAIRRTGIYFSMVTLALAQMVYFVALEAKFTHGEDGIQGVPRGTFLGVLDLSNAYAMYYTTVVIFLIGFGIIYRIVHSPYGQVLKAIRENEPRAISLGYRVDQYKLLAFTLSAGLAGLGGATKAIVFQLASLTDVTWQMSGEVILMTLVGGVGTIFGPLVGATVLVTMETYLSGIGSWVSSIPVLGPLLHETHLDDLLSSVTVIQGVIFVICVMTFRRGLVGELGDLLRKRGSTPAAQPAHAGH